MHADLDFDAGAKPVNNRNEAIDRESSEVKDFKSRGVPIEGVGLQLHVPTIDADMLSIIVEISSNIARLTALGLQVHITELDASLPMASGQPRAEDLTHQAAVCRGIVRTCLNN